MVTPRGGTGGASPGTAVGDRVRAGAMAVAAPVAACALALGGLGARAHSGAAGRPAHVSAVDGRVLLPLVDDSTMTAAFFRLTNDGGTDDEVLSVSSPAARTAMLARTEVSGNAGRMRMGVTLPVPAGGTVSMTAYATDVMVELTHRPALGQRIPFVLRLRRGGQVRAEAVVVRPGG
ncbi:copper chaperone PCu(A)C [Streptomyces sp. TS71-3]|uniref:copper chaperone PCu(A)C n=1 Tax=Streptomyces sp. TS71-3 TaxID=2733862 RepID=UPI001B15F5ED|nr:copper chaperone PCu(A)C [Streptomyces sp. TS71-3]GHJ41266.1 hypothetical protein Sm713_68750 [Streptomyces sp. TS71-3]